jgi:tetratricopeptide (TPR) repeat protein
MSYVAAVEEAIAAAGHVAVDMASFAAADQPPAQLCAQKVKTCEVYVGVLGTRYGSPVRDQPAVSYTELEFDTATQAGLDRLVFLLDTNADGVGIPPAKLIDPEFGVRQEAFRRQVRDSKLAKLSFASPAQLGQLVERSLRELADTRRRIGSGIQREQVPAEPQPVRASKFVNPAPAVAPTWFQDRQVETGLLANYVTNPGIRLVSVVGRGGIGKTAMVCRLLKGLEAGRIPDVEGDSAAITVGGIVYLSPNGTHQVDYPTLVADLLRLVPADMAQRLQHLYQDPNLTPREMMLTLLEAFPVGEPVVVLLDNLESVMDAERETLAEQALYEALGAVLTAPAHAVTVIATTRVMPAALLKVEPARQRQLPLDEGLGSPDAEIVLRALDEDGRLGLRDAPDALLDGLRRHTRGVPRALEAVKAILDGDRTLIPRDLLDRIRNLSENDVVQVLVGEAYDLLDAAGQQVMQALAVYSTPVSAVGVDFLLRPVTPTTDAAPILTRLVRRQLVRFQDRQYYLHPVDRDYARSQLAPGRPGDSPAAFTLAGLQARAADFYSQIRTPRDSWRTLEDVRPQLAEFELRCDTGDYDTAATVLDDIDSGYLQLWGHYRTVVDLRGRIHGRITEPTLNSRHLTSLANCHHGMGEYRQAIDLYTQALAIDRDTGDRQGEGVDLGGLGLCHYRLGDYRQAIDLNTQALAIARDTGDRQGEGFDLGCLGNCHYSQGDYRQAIDLRTQALAIARDTGDRQGEGVDLSALGLCHCRLGDYGQAIDLNTQALAIARAIGDRYGEGFDLGTLGLCHYSLGDYRQAIDLCTEALAIDRDISDRGSEGVDLNILALCRYRLGDFRQAIDLNTQALAIARDISDRNSEGVDLNILALCRYSLGDYRQAIDLNTQALAIARDIGNRYGEANALIYLGRAWLASGDPRRAVTLFEQAVSIADTTGSIEPAVEARSGLASAQLQLDDPAAALASATARRDPLYPAEEPAMRLLEGLALLGLHRVDEGVRAFADAVTAADALLALADRNVAARQARALALSGLAAATGDPARAAEAGEAFAQARAITSAAGMAADTRRLLDGIASHDRSGVLAAIRATQDM